ncbi:MAG: hypothetical protein Roseis2KO_45220 [Roseivirga sp.]
MNWLSDMPWFYVLVAIHVMFLRRLFDLIIHKGKAPPSKKKVFALKEYNRWQKPFGLIIYLVLTLGLIAGTWTIGYHPFLSESATLIWVLAVADSLRHKSQYAFSIDNTGFETPDKRNPIAFKRVISVHFGNNYIEIWSKYIIQYRYELHKNQLGEHWEDFRSTLYEAVKSQDHITVTTT